MGKKKIHETIEEVTLPRALIAGNCSVASLLSGRLKDYGCQVVHLDVTSPLFDNDLKTSGKFNYVFHFANFKMADAILEEVTVPGAKYVFVETDKTEELERNDRIKIVRIGKENSWDQQELADKLLKTMFKGKEGSIADIRKNPSNEDTKESKKVMSEEGSKKAEVVHHISVKTPEKNLDKYLVVKKHSFIKRLSLAMISVFIFLFITGFWAVSFYHYYSLKNNLIKLQSDLSAVNIEEAVLSAGKAKKEFDFFNNIYKFSNKWLLPVRSISYFQQAGYILDAGENLLDTSDDLLSYSQEISAKNFGLLGTGNHITKEEVDEISQKITTYKNELLSAHAKIQQVDLPFFPKEKIGNLISISSEQIKAAEELMPLVEALLFTDRPKTYLVLLQNNMELRPTGGFIGSFALMKVERGRLTDFKLEDVYTADGQLKGHVDPPVPIQKYLSQPHYFLRDSNWDPDFAVSAEQASWFLQKELGVTVDGVIAVNLHLAQKILAILGPVTLPDFNNEKITGDNLFTKAQEYIQKDFFPGSTQKKNFLSSLTKEIFGSLTFKKEAVWFKLLPQVRKALEEKNILIYTHDPDINKQLEKLGYSGRMLEVGCLKNISASDASFSNSLKCYADYLSIVEANLGVNKANYFIEKSVTVEKRIEESGNMVSQITIAYENQSTPELVSDMSYLNYLRLFVPADYKLVSMNYNGSSISAKDIDIENYEKDKISYGLLIKIEAGQKGTLRATFNHNKPFTSDFSSYQFYFQKQPGDKIAPLVLSFVFPQNIVLEPGNFVSASNRENEIYYTTDTSVDRIFALERK